MISRGQLELIVGRNVHGPLQIILVFAPYPTSTTETRGPVVSNKCFCMWGICIFQPILMVILLYTPYNILFKKCVEAFWMSLTLSKIRGGRSKWDQHRKFWILILFPFFKDFLEISHEVSCLCFLKQIWRTVSHDFGDKKELIGTLPPS